MEEPQEVEEIYCGPEDVTIPRKSCVNRLKKIEVLEDGEQTPAVKILLAGLRRCKDCRGKEAVMPAKKNIEEPEVICSSCGKKKSDPEAGRFYKGLCVGCRDKDNLKSVAASFPHVSGGNPVKKGVRAKASNTPDVSAREDVGETATQKLIAVECDAIKTMLLSKNRLYGDSALNPQRVFSKADPIEQLNIRIDDKLSRIKTGQVDDTEDAELDLIGYLILKRVATACHGLAMYGKRER